MAEATRTRWRRWLTADPTISDVAARRTIELVAFITVLMAIASLLAIVVAFVVARHWAVARLPVFAGMLGTYAVLLWLNQTRHHALAALLICVAPLAGNLIVGFTAPTDPVWYAFMPISVVLAGGLLALRTAFVIAVLGVVGTAGAVAVNQEHLRAHGVIYVVFVALYSTLVLGIARFRKRVERERVAEVERLAAQLAATERLESIGRFAGGVAHDFNNLLTVIIANVELARRGRGGADLLNGIEDAAMRAAGLTRQLLAFTRNRASAPVTLELDELIRAMKPLLRRLIPENVALDLQLGSTWSVEADESQLQQVILNLAANARDAMKQGGTLRFTTRDVPAADSHGDRVGLVVSDSGEGMDEKTRARAFEPFFTTKPVGAGTGLGLSTVHGIVVQCGGTIELTSTPGEGTRIAIFFLRSTRLPAREVPTAVSDAVSRKGIALLVEDDAQVRASTERVLRDIGLTVVVAANADEVPRALGDAPGPIELVVSDVVMPGKSGLALCEELRASHPGVSILLMSGYSEEDVAAYAGRSDTRFLAKPFTAAALTAAVKELLGQRALRANAS